MAAHPRSRGENRTVTLYARGDLGSSPLTRGKPFKGSRRRSERGLIPAHAGKTATRPRPRSSRTAHPRSRGENAGGERRMSSLAGSSPLTRGKLEDCVRILDGERLIPAHAGKTSTLQTRRQKCRAHPRSRGENKVRDYDGHRPRGSSPLTRGKRHHVSGHPRQGGLIPAHAGKTRCLSRLTKCLRAHPRSRGENWPCRRR